MNAKIFALSCLMALAQAAPKPDAEADPAYAHGYAAPIAHVGPAPNCKTENDILITQNCVPSTENVCNMITVETEEIEYVPLCKSTTDHLCDAPIAAPVAHAVYKREAEAEAEAEADPVYGLAGGYAHGVAAPVVAPVAAHGYGIAAHHAPAPIVASAVGHSVSATVKHACRDVTTEHCVDNPTVKVVPVEVEHCHVITKVTCTDVENLIPVTTCEAVTTTHVSEAVAVAPAPVVPAVGYAHAGPIVAPVAAPIEAHAGYSAHVY